VGGNEFEIPSGYQYGYRITTHMLVLRLFEEPAYDQGSGKAWEKKNQKFIVKVLVATWRFEISDCVLSPQAYLQ
jgi:hypothetical protein